MAASLLAEEGDRTLGKQFWGHRGRTGAWDPQAAVFCHAFNLRVSASLCVCRAPLPRPCHGKCATAMSFQQLQDPCRPLAPQGKLERAQQGERLGAWRAQQAQGSAPPGEEDAAPDPRTEPGE